MPSSNTNSEVKDKKIEFDKNIILFGPPGTGKTYNSIIYAVAICDNRSIDDVREDNYENVLKRFKHLSEVEHRVAFTTFHQSYGYEDFIEGIKPQIKYRDSDSLNDDATGGIDYACKPGVFKEFCNRAENKITTIKDKKVHIAKDSHVWCINLGGDECSDLKTFCFKENSIRIGWIDCSENISYETDFKDIDPYVKSVLLAFHKGIKIGDIVVSRSSISSVDGIGIVTSDVVYDKGNNDITKWYPRKRSVKWLTTGSEIDIRDVNQGTRIDRKTLYCLFRVNPESLLSKLSTNENIDVKSDNAPHVFIIDEINRGNISKIFGELITLIEPSKRIGAKESTKVILPYSQLPFGVPNNVYIIGTMNTADRSISQMDTALRRRFSFIEMLPDEKLLQRLNLNVDLVDVSKLLRTINKRIECLFDREHTIGHSFFMELKDNHTISKLSDIFKKSVIPLLQEYFYEDYNKIMLVLGDNCKSKEDYQFIKKVSVNAKDIFKGNDSEIDLPEFTYEINLEAFKHIESYIEIYKTVKQTDNKQ